MKANQQETITAYQDITKELENEHLLEAVNGLDINTFQQSTTEAFPVLSTIVESKGSLSDTVLDFLTHLIDNIF